MTGAEYLEGYFRLILDGYTHEEAKEILEEIKEEMERDNPFFKGYKPTFYMNTDQDNKGLNYKE